MSKSNYVEQIFDVWDQVFKKIYGAEDGCQEVDEWPASAALAEFNRDNGDILKNLIENMDNSLPADKRLMAESLILQAIDDAEKIIKDNMANALIDPLPYIRTYAELLANKK